MNYRRDPIVLPYGLMEIESIVEHPEDPKCIQITVSYTPYQDTLDSITKTVTINLEDKYENG